MVGVQIGEYHTWKDWGLYLQKIELSEPVKKEYKVSVPSGNGSIDLSDTLTGGEPRFENRTLKMTFIYTFSMRMSSMMMPVRA